MNNLLTNTNWMQHLGVIINRGLCGAFSIDFKTKSYLIRNKNHTLGLNEY